MNSELLLLFVSIAAFILAYCYLLVSIAAQAWYDRKLKHYQSILNNLENGEKNNGS